MTRLFYQISADAALAHLKTDRHRGLSESEVAHRRLQYGSNIIQPQKQRSIYRLILGQLNDLLILLLIVAAGLAYYLKDNRGGTILLVIVIVNVGISVYQVYKAEKILEHLKKLIKTNAIVVRDGMRKVVDEHELVPGDIVFLEEGNSVPADIRLIETHEFSTNDFLLTGESLPQEKHADIVINQETTLSNQDNLTFFGTTVATGNAHGVVFATGMHTSIGDIAKTSQTIEKDISPLQQEINSLAKTLTKLAGVIALALFVTNMILQGHEFDSFKLLVNSSLLFAIGVAAACVPQGLPAQITVALSLGVRRLARNNAIVKRLSSVETLGSTNVICSDKTGTITRNEMTIVRCWVNGRDLEVSGEGYQPTGEIYEDGIPLSTRELADLKHFFGDGFLASHGRTHEPDAEHPGWYAIGDPTEAAFMPLTIKAGLSPNDLEAGYPLICELPFDNIRKCMTMIRKHMGHTIGYMKGATANVLDSCDKIHSAVSVLPLTEAERKTVMTKADELSAQSLRVMALAYRDFPPSQMHFTSAETEKEFVFAGLVGMFDPPRRGIEEAITSIHRAHIRIFMITGDDHVTAEAIAKRIGMGESRVLTDDNMRSLSDHELRIILQSKSLIFSRVSPSDKYRIVRLLKELGEVVAVTGDGVNDTLSLKKADIGVAMGGIGSDVAKEAAEIVLIDDNFSTLAAAIFEGRTIFQNLRRVIMSSINSNIGELSIVVIGFIGVANGLPIPITAVQILAIDLIAEMLPLMALTFDRPEPFTMQQPPRKLGDHIVNARSLGDLLFFGILMGTVSYFSFYMVLQNNGTLGMSQAAAYTSIALAQYINILSRRTPKSIFKTHQFANRYLWGALAISLLAVLVIVNVSAIGIWFGFEPMRLIDWLWPVCGAVVFLLIFELRKLIQPEKVTDKLTTSPQ